MLMLKPMPPQNRFDFTIEPDSTFNRGDHYLLQFMADFIYQDGSKDGMLYVAIDYPDTIVARKQRFSYSGLSQLRLETSDTADVKSIRGFFYLGGAHVQATTQRMLFINSIQLIRFHKQNEPKDNATDSIPSGADAQRADSDSVGHRDQFGDSAKVLPLGGGKRLHRVVSR
jgi:hypothetical protein